LIEGIKNFMITDQEAKVISILAIIILTLIGIFLNDKALGPCLFLIFIVPGIYYLRYGCITLEVIILLPVLGILIYIMSIIPLNQE
jgi:hypothetical protein